MRHDPHAFDRDATAIERLDEDARREILSAYLDDELSPEAARHVTAWLDENPDALRRLEHDRRIWDLLAHGYEDEPVPEGFAPAVLTRVRPSALRTPWRRWAPLAAAAAVLLAFGTLLLRHGPDDAASEGAGREVASSLAVETVPVEYLEEVDVLLALSEEEFDALLLAEVEVPWEGDS